ncbi:MAG: glycosyltransferase [Bryobacterales bacterium]
MTLSVVIPALNEEGGIAEVIERIQSAGPDLDAMGIDTEILVVDDGSVDRTAEIVRSLPGASAWCSSTPSAAAMARRSRRAFRPRPANCLHFPTRTALIRLSISRSLQGRHRAKRRRQVVGSRPGAKSEMPAVRRLGNLIWSTIVSLLASRTCRSGQRHARLPPVGDPASSTRCRMG